MDIIDNLIYTTLNAGAAGVIPGTRPITSDYIVDYSLLPPGGTVPILGPPFSYDFSDRMRFCAFDDPQVIERAMLLHWHDVRSQFNYDTNGVQAPRAAVAGANRFSTFEESSNYHLIYSYLIENTRILQIFERLIEKYLSEEEFGIINDSYAFNWLQNSERLFFKNDTPRAANIRSLIRPNSDASRRNAYWRLLGMDLAFGDINSSNGLMPYIKAKVSNMQFVPLFEKFLSEIWQGYINSINTSGVNTADVNIINDLARQLRELLWARRGGNGTFLYSNMNLSREEYSAMLMTSWFTFIISRDTPVVQFLNCQSSSVSERLLKIGSKVGIPAHSKCESLFEMAGPALSIFNILESALPPTVPPGTLRYLEDPTRIRVMLYSLNPPASLPPPFPTDKQNMNNFLTLINNWEKATGHRIKNPEANIRGNVSIAQQRRMNGKMVEPSLT